MSDLFSYTPKPNEPRNNERGDNAPTFSVSELSGALKKTIETTYGHVRVRGELSRVTVAKSGHMYSSLKDENAVIDAICWRGQMGKLSIQPEEGMEVICTGRLSTYPGRSSYQLIIETMELAGEGALLKMLEERKKKLAAEGLFDPARKQLIPYLPQSIGIITSPTGAVIRDILHRISDRFPVHVTLWPVMVQGQGAADQVTAALRGFNNLPNGFTKPDLLIVARGGGSLEDLMPFNEEHVVRAIADSMIPVISAIGHETDVTLCDFAADQRAPTPTGAAEMAVPVRRDLINTVEDYASRARHRIYDFVQKLKDRTSDYESTLMRFPRYLEQKQQRFDYAADNLPNHYRNYLTQLDNRLTKTSARLKTPQALLYDAQTRLQKCDPLPAYKSALQKNDMILQRQSSRLRAPSNLISMGSQTLQNAYKNFTRNGDKIVELRKERLHSSTRLLETLSFKNVLKRGYSVVRDDKNNLIKTTKEASQTSVLKIEFSDGEIKAKPER